MTALKNLVESTLFQRFIIAVIIINAVTLGMETSATLMSSSFAPVLVWLDHIALCIFVIELTLKLVLYRHRFFCNGWNIFDFLIVGISLLPVTDSLSVLRALRTLRALRLISAVPSMRKVVNALLRAIPGIGSVIAILFLLFYVTAVMATKLFGSDFPEWFGSISSSLLTLFQIMTLDSWASGVLRPIMEIHPWAWVFFILFVLIATFAVLNLFIAIIVDTMRESDEQEQQETRNTLQSDHLELLHELRELRREVSELRQLQDR